MNGKARQPAPVAGVFKPEVIKDVADSLGITALPDGVASALASDVEYRIHQVIEEAARFMRHARRTTLTTADIDQALRVLNIEPLYGHAAQNHPAFRRAAVGVYPPVYFVEDEEIDFDKVLKEEKVFLPKPVTWAAHWLAIEGVQPLVPENPPQAPIAERRKATPPRVAAPGAPSKKKQPVKNVLSRELQLYYNRLTSSLLPPDPKDQTKRIAALASLRSDAGLQALLPYLVRWVGEKVVHALKSGSASDTDGRVLEIMMDVLGALLDNQTLFVEPYLHQMLPPILSTLLTSSLPPMVSMHLRIQAAQTMSRLLTQHSATYPSLSPRLMKALLVALLSHGKSKGTREGAIRGLVGVGKEAVRMGLLDAGGLKILGSECTVEDVHSSVVAAALDALKTLHAPSPAPSPLSLDDPLLLTLRAALGELFTSWVAEDGEWSAGLAAQLGEQPLPAEDAMEGVQMSRELEEALAGFAETLGTEYFTGGKVDAATYDVSMEGFEVVDGAEVMERVA